MAKEETEFDKALDQSMNKDGFAEFLAKNQAKKGIDDKEIEDENVMEERMETFEAIGIVKKELTDLYTQELSQKLGIELSAQNFKSINDYIEKISIENPERLLELKEKTDKHKDLQKSIASTKSTIRTIQKSRKTGILANMGGFITGGLYKGKLMWKENRAGVNRGELFDEIEEIDGLHDDIKKAVAKKMNDMLSSANSFEKLSQTQESFEKIQNAQENGSLGIDLLGDLPEEAFQIKLDAAVEKLASEEIMTALVHAELGNNALTKMENVLNKYLVANKMGSKEGDEAREMIIKSMENATMLTSTLTDTNERAKRLIMLRIIQKAKNEQY